ncbi:simple sugar transport system substrate-binding protein/ribose transport system substrate-binding protein [Streptomyces zhaozhouensis]|uniref:Simple sugar transport system substrate-binding protein/ribose transport system substrate-binding protein n=1 Tax=Streptomyces zhaozhouensis TaxID=1300267 RepID=A0A286DKH1_9ACTN|nr:simple sugar transport system substrate-binding protein/ribose transport system substrate-binding protein [Streptomyces zhaozhouensis]
MKLRLPRLAGTLLLSTALLTACADDPGGGAEGATIGVDYPRSDTDFWNSYIDYVPEYAERLGLDMKTTNSGNDVATLASNVQTLLSQGVDGVAIAPQDTAAVAPVLRTLAERDIPVVTVDTRPDEGEVYMVVRADNRAYGEQACHYLGSQLEGEGKVVMLQGDLASINGRDRTEAFHDCVEAEYPGIRVFGEATNWDAATAAQKLQTTLTAHPDVRGVYMQATFGLSGTLQVLDQLNMAVPPDDPEHVFVVSNDGIPQELQLIGEGKIDATVSQPADLYAEYALTYLRAALDGEEFEPGPTDHGSEIVEVREGVLEDQLPAPLVTRDGGTYGGVESLPYDDPSLWGNDRD